MYKKITVQQLRLGMHVHALGGSWIHHPFWRSAFLLNDPEDLQQLRASRVPEVWIDTDKGLDVHEDEVTANDAPEQAAPPTLEVFMPQGTTEATPLGLEIAHARALCAQAREAVMEMFSEARMGQSVNMLKNSALATQITESVIRNPDALISMARLKTADDYTYMHSVAVSALMVALAKQLGFDDENLHRAAMAGLLHDIGKAHSNLEILNKPGSLTDAEFAHMKHHPIAGYELLRHSVQDQEVLDACRHHHERLDGTGYPDGLKGEQIGQLARMNTICDVYDAITSDRPYKKGWSPAIAIQHMAKWRGNHLDAHLFGAFVKTLGVYPIGSLVRLSNGELAVVYAPCKDNLLCPKVVRFYDTSRHCLTAPPVRTDLSLTPDLTIVQREEPHQWSFTNLESLWQAAAHADTQAEALAAARASAAAPAS